MEVTRYHNSFLLTRFREFYRELAHMRSMVELSSSVTTVGDASVAAAASAGGSSGSGGATSTIAPSEVSVVIAGAWQQLVALLERQAAEAGQSGGAFGFEVYREAQYVMAALADEVFLNMEWEGRDSWPLLESRLFQSHIAGELVFQRLNRLLQRRDPFYNDLASVYFMALSLGFQGKFRGADEALLLPHYRRQLFAMIYGRHPKLYTEDQALFPQSGQHTIDKGAGKKLPDQRVWLGLLALVILSWLVVSEFAWTSVSAPLQDAICRVTNSCATG